VRVVPNNRGQPSIVFRASDAVAFTLADQSILFEKWLGLLGSADR
jgi:hypothetical protein